MEYNETKLFLQLHAEDFAFFSAVCNHLTNEQLWQEQAGGVPIANIICHTCEMEGFWIDWGLCGHEFERSRQIEFDRRNDLTGPDLIRRLQQRKEQTAQNIVNLSREQWEKERIFHGDMFTGATILAWHLRHLGMHRGQVQILERNLR